jgi:hypothetical protein
VKGTGFTGCGKTRDSGEIGGKHTSGAKQAAEKVPVRGESIPQRLKPGSLQSICVRPEGRTLQKDEFFRSL